MLRTTWVAARLDLARRRFRSAPPPPADDAVAGDVSDVAVSVARTDLERLMNALAACLDPALPRPDSPARLAAALTTAIVGVAGRGEPEVTRSPAGLYTPEYWHIRIDRADAPTRELLARLTTGGRAQ